ncbi:MAG: glycosyltransferase family 9 protein [Flavobacteriaceae bacterium]|nr:glycosyltransferase family 9 protein [Flavobacteriaceae bacterium]
MKKIIIRTPNFIGDTVMMLPALELVRMEYPDAEITVVCKPHSAELFRGKGIAKIIVDDTKGKGRFNRTLKFVKQLRQEKYDLGILFHNSFLTALLFRLARIKTLIGYEKEGRKFLLDFSLPIDRNWHYSNHYANLVNLYFGNKYTELPQGKLVHKKSELVEKKASLLVGFVLGGENKGARRYPLELGKQLFEKLSAEEVDIVLLGDKQDCENHQKYAEVLKENGANCTDLTGKTTVAGFIDAIAELDLLVTIDTSAMHIASAVGTEFVVLVGKGTSPFSVVYPKFGKGHILEKGQLCLRGEDMIKSISPNDIYGKIMEILNKKANFGDKSSS